MSPRPSFEEYCLGPSIYILNNLSFSSSHQDRLWEEQIEAYSNGGTRTFNHEKNPTVAVFLALIPTFAVSGNVLRPSSALLSIRKGTTYVTIVLYVNTWNEKGKSQSGEKSRKAKKMSKPHTPLQSIFAIKKKAMIQHKLSQLVIIRH